MYSKFLTLALFHLALLAAYDSSGDYLVGVLCGSLAVGFHRCYALSRPNEELPEEAIRLLFCTFYASIAGAAFYLFHGHLSSLTGLDLPPGLWAIMGGTAGYTARWEEIPEKARAKPVLP